MHYTTSHWHHSFVNTGMTARLLLPTDGCHIKFSFVKNLPSHVMQPVTILILGNHVNDLSIQQKLFNANVIG